MDTWEFVSQRVEDYDKNKAEWLIHPYMKVGPHMTDTCLSHVLHNCTQPQRHQKLAFVFNRRLDRYWDWTCVCGKVTPEEIRTLAAILCLGD
jgi:hypothetical protein